MRAERPLPEDLDDRADSLVRARGTDADFAAVADNGVAVEAVLENPTAGTYHGYPLPESDPLAGEVIRRWRRA